MDESNIVQEEDSELNNDASRPGKRKWAPEEDDILSRHVEKYGPSDWVPVSKQLGRTGIQCCQRWSYVLDPNINKGPWVETEDEILLQHVLLRGATDWASVGRELGRTGIQCRNRWTHQLDPKINKGFYINHHELEQEI